MRSFQITFFLFFVLVTINKSFSQDVIWTRVLAGQQEEYGNTLNIDKDGNVIIAGSFRDICYGGNFALFSSGSNDAFIEKMSPTGVRIWTKQFGNGNSDNAHSVVSDSNGNIYLAGTFTGSVNFGGGNLNSPVTNSNFFLLKFDPDGTVLWRKAIPGYSSHRPKLTVDNNDNLFITGIFFGERDFGNTNIDSDDGCGYVAKINNSNGNIVWVRQFGSGTTLIPGTPVPVNVTTSNFVTDTTGNIFVTGCFRGHGRFGNQNFIIENSEPNAFIMKINSTGSILWTKRYTGPTEGTSLVIDSNNNIYTAGKYLGTANINNTTYTSPSGLYSVYLQKLDSEGNPIWFKDYFMNTAESFEAHPQLAIDGSSNLFFKCLFGWDKTITFENQTFSSMISTNPNVLKQQILASFDGNGNNLWVNQYENPNDNIQFGVLTDKTTNIAVNQTGLYFTCGSSRFNNVSYSNESGANIFAAKLSLPYTLHTTNPSFDLQVNLFPNPTSGNLTLSMPEKHHAIHAKIYNNLGQLVSTQYFENADQMSIELHGESGLYFVEIQSGETKTTKKVLKK